MTALSNIWAFIKARWSFLVILFAVIVYGIASCSQIRTLTEQRDAALEVVARQQELAHKLAASEARADEARRQLAEAEARADAVDQQALEDIYERVNVEGSAAGVLNDLINAGELP